MLAGPDEIIGVIPPEVPGRVPPDVPLVGAVVAGELYGIEDGCPSPGILLVVQPKIASAAASVVLANICLLLTTLRIQASFVVRQDSERYLEQDRGLERGGDGLGTAVAVPSAATVRRLCNES